MVLVGYRGAEERHDAVPHDLGHPAFVKVNRFHHALEDAIKNLPARLGIAIGQDLHGSLQIREQDGHMLPFALQYVLRVEDPLGEVTGRVGPRKYDFRTHGGPRTADALAAVETEAGGLGKLRSACTTREHKLGPPETTRRLVSPEHPQAACGNVFASVFRRKRHSRR